MYFRIYPLSILLSPLMTNLSILDLVQIQVAEVSWHMRFGYFRLVLRFDCMELLLDNNARMGILTLFQ